VLDRLGQCRSIDGGSGGDSRRRSRWEEDLARRRDENEDREKGEEGRPYEVGTPSGDVCLSSEGRAGGSAASLCSIRPRRAHGAGEKKRTHREEERAPGRLVPAPEPDNLLAEADQADEDGRVETLGATPELLGREGFLGRRLQVEQRWRRRDADRTSWDGLDMKDLLVGRERKKMGSVVSLQTAQGKASGAG
jgi:hypothetical protein